MKKRPSILIISDLFPLSEKDYAGIYVVDYANSVKPWFDVAVFHPKLISPQKGIGKKSLFGLEVTTYSYTNHPIGKLKKLVAYNAWFKQATAIGSKIGKFDLIHAHGSALAGNVARRIAKLQNIPYVITEHTGPFSTISDNKMRLKYCKTAVQDAAALLNVSLHSQQEMNSAGVSHPKQQVTFNPINDDLFKLGLAVRKKQFSFVSRFDEFKGGLRTVKAFYDAGLTDFGWSLVMVGEGEELNQITEFVKKYQLSSVSVLGFQTKEKIVDIMQESAAFVFPSRHETFGLVVAESLACGTPVICTNQTAPSEYTDANSCIPINPESIEEIGGAMLRIANQGDGFNHEVIARRTKEAFGLEAFGAKLKDIYLQHIQS